MTNSKGQSIIEVMIGLALISIMLMTFTEATSSMQRIVSGTVNLSETDQLVADIAENIKTDFESYQVDFNFRQNIDEVLKSDNLPMAWDIGFTGPSASCPKCPGRYGYVIRPIEHIRGLYQVTLRLTNTTWQERGEPAKDYTFVVSAK